jgi:AcrR family transcriptional regulator
MWWLSLSSSERLSFRYRYVTIQFCHVFPTNAGTGQYRGGVPAPAPGGRPRDQAIDAAVVAAAVAVLNEEGIEAVTFARVAERAGTSRPALYRRFGSHDELVIAALRSIAERSRPEPTGDHRADLEGELRSFRDAITSTNSVTLVGSMLVGSVDEQVRQTYRELIVQPRRDRIGAILSAARAGGAITGAPADLDVAVTMCTGSFYAYALAGRTPPRDWPKRVARLVWRAAGGVDD